MMTKNKLYYRESIISLLHDIAAESPSESFDELVCGWFDDLYLPGSNPEGYNHDVHEKGVVEFNNCFHQKEIHALELFHQTFSAQLKNITGNIQYQEMVTNKYWQKIRHAASKALEAFNNKNDRKITNRVAGGISPPAPTTPCVRVRTGRFTELIGP